MSHRGLDGQDAASKLNPENPFCDSPCWGILQDSLEVLHSRSADTVTNAANPEMLCLVPLLDDKAQGALTTCRLCSDSFLHLRQSERRFRHAAAF